MNRITSALFGLGVFIAAAGPASAHAMLNRADPMVGSDVKTAPKAITLEFSEGVEPALSSVSMTDASGRKIALGALKAETKDKRTITAPVAAALQPGAYKVTWRAVSVDSHVTHGDFTFTVEP